VVLVFGQSEGLVFKIKPVVHFSNTVSKFLRDCRLLIALALDEPPHPLQQLKRNAVRVHRVILIEKIEPLLLLECTQDELLLLCVSEEEGLAQEGEVQLACPVEIVEDLIDKQPRSDTLVKGQ